MPRPIQEDGEFIWLITQDEVAEKAREDGANLVPPSDAANPGAYEQYLTTTTESEFARKKKPILEKARKLGDELKRTGVTLDALNPKVLALSPVDHLDVNLRADAEQARPDAVSLIIKKLRAEAFLNHFRHENNLLRPAERRKKPLDVAAIILLFLLIETVMNAWFYSAGVGLLAGAMFALLFSIVTALIGFFTGYLGRYRNAPLFWEKVFGWLAILVGSVVAIYLSSVTATFRALMEVARNQEAGPVASTLSTTMFQQAVSQGWDIFFLHVPFQEMHAMLLFAIAIFAFINAAVAGYTCIDPVPNYTKYSERVDEDERAVNASIRKLREDLALAAERLTNERRSILTEAQGLATNSGRHLNDVKEYNDAYQRLERSVNNTHEQYIALYRDENTHIRTTQPPGYFKREVEYVELCDPHDIKLLTELQSTATSQEEQTKKLASEFGKLNEDIQQINTSRANLAQLVTQLTDEWRKEAEDRIGAEPWAGPRN
jgi:hypothetical protein